MLSISFYYGIFLDNVKKKNFYFFFRTKIRLFVFEKKWKVKGWVEMGFRLVFPKSPTGKFYGTLAAPSVPEEKRRRRGRRSSQWSFVSVRPPVQAWFSKRELARFARARSSSHRRSLPWWAADLPFGVLLPMHPHRPPMYPTVVHLYLVICSIFSWFCSIASA